jgi:hypothetical protein
MAKQPSVNHLLERAVVKVLIGNVFKGTGFFISPDYLLTAYHCLGDLVDEENLFVENQTYGRMRVILDRDKSLRDPKLDIAVLRLADVVTVTDCLPLGVITETQRGDEILAVGYPAGTLSFISGEIHGFPEEFPQQFFNNAMKAKGQSGGVVYHPTLRRVVGIALELYHQEVVANGGLAGRFDVLLRQWQELKTLNQQAMDRWDKLLQPKPLLSKPIVMTWGGVIVAVVLGVWLLLGRGCQFGITQVATKDSEANLNIGTGTIEHTYGKNADELLKSVTQTNEELCSQQMEMLKKQCDLSATRIAVNNFFKSLGKNPVPVSELDNTLREIAERYNTLEKQVAKDRPSDSKSQ